jgi:hypothetical protein
MDNDDLQRSLRRATVDRYGYVTTQARAAGDLQIADDQD